MYQYFRDMGFPKLLLIFVLSQIAGTALAILAVEALPMLKGMPDASFEILRAGPNLLLTLWFLYDMRQKRVDFLGDFKRVREQIAVLDLGAIVCFNILAGLFSIYALIYAAVTFLPSDALSDVASSNGVNTTTSMVGVILASLGAVLLAPPAEEFIFRGALPAQLQKVMAIWPSFLISSVLFAAIHFSASALTTFLFAITLCIVVYKTKNIAIAIILHMANNLFVSIVQIYGQLSAADKKFDMSGIAHQFLYIGIPCLLGAAVLGYYLIKKRDFLNLNVGFKG